MSRTKSAAIQFSGAMILMALSVIQGLVLMPLYLHYIGGYLYGAWVALAGSVMLLGIADVGISSLAIQKSSVLHAKRDYRSIAKLIGTMRVINFITALVVIVFAALLIPLAPKLLRISSQYHPILLVVAWLAVVELVLMLFVNVSGSFLFGIQNPGPHMTASIVGSIFSILFMAGFLYFGLGVISLSLGAIIRPLMVLPFNLYTLRRFLIENNVYTDMSWDREMFRDLISKTVWLGPAKIAETFLGQIDGIIIARFVGAGAVTVFSVTRKMSDLVVQVVGLVSATLLSGLSHLHGAGETSRQREVVEMLLKTVSYSSAVFLGGFLAFNEAFVSLWVGRQYYGGTELTVLLFAYGVLKLGRIALYNIVFSVGKIATSAKSTVVEIVVQAGLALVFVQSMGLAGIVLGGIFGVILSGLMQIGCLVSGGIIERKAAVSIITKAIALALCAVIPTTGVLGVMDTITWLILLCGGAAYGALSFIILWLLDKSLVIKIRTLVGERFGFVV